MFNIDKILSEGIEIKIKPRAIDNSSKVAAEQLTKALCDVGLAARSFDENYKTISLAARKVQYDKMVKKLETIWERCQGQIQSWGNNVVTLQFFDKLFDNPDLYFPEQIGDKKDKVLVGHIVALTRQLRKANNISAKISDTIESILVDNKTDTVQMSQFKSLLDAEMRGNKTAHEQVKSRINEYNRKADAADKEREEVLAGKDVADKNINAKKVDGSTKEDLHNKYASGLNAGTVEKAKSYSIDRWADLNTGFGNHYLLIQNWKNKGIAPDKDHKIYMVGKIDGNPVFYIAGEYNKFYMANRNWWSGVKDSEGANRAKFLTSIKNSCPEYTASGKDVPEDIMAKFGNIAKRASVMTEKAINDREKAFLEALKRDLKKSDAL